MRAIPYVLPLLTLGVGLLGSRLHAEESSFTQIQLGRYLAIAGDCASCHTAPNGRAFSGGLAIETPFGIIYSSNITPDRATGIGKWSAAQFYRAMHEGISADGTRLYPAMPYPYFNHVERSDIDAIYAYLMTIAPVSNTPAANQLPFPLNERVVMRGWNWLFFNDGASQRWPSKSATWKRGAYLVEGLAHCGACHTPKTFLGAEKSSQGLAGANLQDWFAPNLGKDLRTGLGSWTISDIVEYLKTGRNKEYNATGPMSEVVANSTSKLSDDDLVSIATYLKDLPGDLGNSASLRSGQMQPPHSGAAIYDDTCAACHGESGKGVDRMFPALRGSSSVQQADPTSIIRVILNGARTVATDSRPTPVTMPAYGWKLSDAQVAAVANYVRNAWGNSAPALSAKDVTTLRNKLSSK